MNISNTRKNLPESIFSKLFALASKKGMINLSVGQPDLDPPPVVKDALKGVKNFRYTHSDGMPELRKAISEKLRKENGIHVSEDEVIVTCGGEEAIIATALTYLNPGDNVILFSPYFSGYTFASLIPNANIKEVPFIEKRAGIDFDTLERTINKKTKMIILNSPNNPTGGVVKGKDIEGLVSFAEDKDLLLVSDEVYEKIIYEGGHVSPASYSDKNVLTVNSFSKTYCLPGIRVGYIAGRKDLIEPIKMVHLALTACAPSISQRVALACLRYKKREEYIAGNLSTFRRRRNLLKKLLEENNLDSWKMEGAFYAYVTLPKGIDGTKLSLSLVKKGVLVVPGEEFGGRKNELRISYAAPDEKIVEGIGRLVKTIKKLR